MVATLAVSLPIDLLNHYVVDLKLMYHCMSTMLQLKKQTILFHVQYLWVSVKATLSVSQLKPGPRFGIEY